jgi:hypothetical protein
MCSRFQHGLVTSRAALYSTLALQTEQWILPNSIPYTSSGVCGRATYERFYVLYVVLLAITVCICIYVYCNIQLSTRWSEILLYLLHPVLFALFYTFSRIRMYKSL